MVKRILAGAALAALASCGEYERASLTSALSPEESGLGAVVSHVPVCPGPAALGSARCHSRVRTDEQGQPLVTTAPAGYDSEALQVAYALPAATAGAGQVIAVVDAYDDPTAETDMAVYRQTFGLPSCTSASGCFRKVNQAGTAGSYPRSSQGWALEISLDLDMASAICPLCKIILVEAKSASLANLGAAENTAVRLGATVVSNSWGASEYSAEVNDENLYFNHPGVAITVSSGDSGYGAEFPAASRFVTAVGGTTLTVAANTRGYSESAWSGAGSGCSAYVAKPVWQTDAGCANRTTADVSAVADPATGVAVYDSTGYMGRRGWFVVGGTSASAPIIAATYALAGNAATFDYASYPYANAGALFDVTTGKNGNCGTYLCTAGTGYDGPTGLGTPNGSDGF
jgi:subtilase family serine protease